MHSASEHSPPASNVWLLAASLGGPDAVKEFFDHLPAGLPVAFIYAQHIDPRFEVPLKESIGRHSAYPFKSFQSGQQLHHGEVLVAPVADAFNIDSQAYFHNCQQPWDKPYTPSINQIIKQLDQHYGDNAGYIFFSGMGDDGSQALQQLTTADVAIWVQSQPSCQNSSMVEHALNSGKVSYLGTPQELAEHLYNYLEPVGTTHD